MPRPTLEVADTFRQHGAAYREAHWLPLERLRVMRAIEVCRPLAQTNADLIRGQVDLCGYACGQAALGGNLEKCDHCAEEHNACNSCRNRHR